MNKKPHQASCNSIKWNKMRVFNMSFLSSLDHSSICYVVEDYENLSWNDKGDVLNKLKNRYHIQNVIRNPHQAVEELVLRILFELFRGILDTRDLCKKSRWSKSLKRDVNHNMRIYNLLRCIRKSSNATRYLQKFKWLMKN